MPRSVKIHPDHKPNVLSALERNGFLTQGDLAAHLGIALSTVSNFVNSKPVYISKFEEICEALGLDKREITKSVKQDGGNFSEFSLPEGFFAYDSSWVGRENLVKELSDKIRGSSRLLLILGLTGIGKTALAEKLAVELQDWFGGDWKNKFCRANFDYKDTATDFASVAKQWLDEWGEKIPPEDNKPERLLQRLVKRLRENRVLVLIDSLEKLLTGNEEDGWGDFADEWWEKFFLSLLSAESCQSRIIVTSLDLPVKLVDFRYRSFWHRQVLYGLSQSEQEALFDLTGLDISQDSPDRDILLRIGKAYKGHPLVLRVIIGEIWESFDGNVQAYWNEVSSKIVDVENALAEAERGITVGEKDEWELHKLTRQVREQVNKNRLRDVFNRLEKQVRDAYVLICAASVYRVPVQQEGWLMQLINFVKRLENQACSKERQEKALDELCNRFLIEESVNHNNKRVFGQNNLIRSVALEEYRKLLESIKYVAKSNDNVIMTDSATPGQLLFAKLDINLDEITIDKISDYTAVEYFLTVEDEPPPDATNLEKVKRYLESFHHLCEAEDWDRAKEIVFAREITPSGKELHQQLNIWSYPSEQIELCKRLLGKLELRLEGVLMCSLGIAYDNLGQYKTSIEYHKKFLEIGRKLNNQEFIGAAMGGLGNAYHSLGEYHKAIEYYKQAFDIHDRNSDLEGMCSAIGNIGNEYYALGDLQKAFEYYEQYLITARQFGYREKEAAGMQSLGNWYRVMGQCETAIEYLKDAIVIFQEIGNRAAEAATLNDLGVAYKNSGHYQDAIDCQKKSLAICREVGNKQGEATSLGNLGVTYYNLEQYEMAIDYQEKALAICRDIGDKDGEGRAFLNMGNVYAKMGQTSKTFLLSMKALLIYNSLQIHHTVNRIINEKFAPSVAYLGKDVYQRMYLTLFEEQLQEIAAEYGNTAAERIVQLIATTGNQ